MLLWFKRNICWFPLSGTKWAINKQESSPAVLLPPPLLTSVFLQVWCPCCAPCCLMLSPVSSIRQLWLWAAWQTTVRTSQRLWWRKTSCHSWPIPWSRRMWASNPPDNFLLQFDFPVLICLCVCVKESERERKDAVRGCHPLGPQGQPFECENVCWGNLAAWGLLQNLRASRPLFHLSFCCQPTQRLRMRFFFLFS